MLGRNLVGNQQQQRTQHMAPGDIYVTIVRTGKQEVTEAVQPGTTVREVFEKAGIPSSTYSGWSITDEEGDSLTLDSQLHNSTALVCGGRVDGAA
jgi:hypothetical protein